MSTEILAIETFEFGSFRLDGGSMFGSVPKTLWSKKIPSDTDNRIPLTTRSLLLRTRDKLILVDTGMGEMWSDKERAIFGILNHPRSTWPFAVEQVTDIVLTHLHFDHAGGIAELDGTNEPRLAFPNARIHLQIDNLENARAPSPKERASYLERVIKPLNQAQMNLIEGSKELMPGIKVHKVDGHTVGQQWLEISANNSLYLFATDVIPTAHHLPPAYHMGYDACATTLLREKQALLDYAVEKDAIVIFEHDKDTEAGRVGIDARGSYYLTEALSISAHETGGGPS